MAMKDVVNNHSQHFDIEHTKNGDIFSTQSFALELVASSLDVTPSPCTNGVGGKRPSAYSYHAVKTAWPQGQWVQQYEYGHDVYQVIYRGVFGTTLGNFGYARPASHEADADSRALNKLYSLVKSSEVSLNTSIGEGRETLEMMRDIVKSAGKLRKSLKKLKRNLALDPLQTVGGLWLGWSVGLKPLLSDCENIRNHMANPNNDEIELRPVKSRASGFNKAVHANGSVEVSLSQYIQYGLRWRLRDLHLYENWRLGLTARPTLVWELTTLSFVVDYFVNIGQYLELLEASMYNNGIEFIDGYRTITQRTVEDWKFDESTPRSGPDNVSPSTVRFKVDGIQIQTAKERRVLTAFPPPPLPVFKIPRASGALLNIAALLSQILQKRA